MGWLAILILACISAYIAKNKNRSVVLWFILGLFFPLIAVVVVALLSPAAKLPASGWGNDPRLNAPGASPEEPLSSTEKNDYIDVPFTEKTGEPCPSCGKLVNADAKYCEHCGHKLKFKFNLDKKSDPLSDATQRCAKCGELMAKDAAFCPNCGNRAPQN